MKPTRRLIVAQLSALALTACAPGAKTAGSTDEDTGPDGGDGRDGSDGGDGTDGTDGTDGGDGADGTDGGAGWEAECATDDVALPDDCGRGTPFQSEGPFLRDDVPERSELNVTGDTGDVLILTGRVVDSTCAPVEGVTILVWMAGGEARFYDTESGDANLYGKQTTGTDGVYCFRTLRPTPYGPEDHTLPAHIHVAVVKDGARLLTTQLYFEGDPYLDGLDFAPPPELITSPETLADGSFKLHFDFALPPEPYPG